MVEVGETRVKFRVYSGEGFAELEGLVDTGATFTKIPRSAASKIGLQAKYTAEVMLGDRRTVTRELALGEVEIEGVRRPVLVAIGGDEEIPVVGYTTLEILGFKVNPITGKLERTPAIEL
ncbi:MAG: aspartyl protease family protein [Thermofilum sp.]|nr:aspartyl protease family protein [Thermofilum sp.]